MTTEAANAITDLISVCRDHEQHDAGASLRGVIAGAKRAHALLAASWHELGAQAVIEEELAVIDSHLHRIIALLERMEAMPQRSYRAELAIEHTHLCSINDALRELLEYRATVRDGEALMATIVAAGAMLHSLRLVASRREDAAQRWPELPALRVVGQVHLEKIVELAHAELRALSDARFCFKRWQAEPGGQHSRHGYVFENRRYFPASLVPAGGGDSLTMTRHAMAEHQERAFSTFSGVSTIHRIVEALSRAASSRRRAAA